MRKKNIPKILFVDDEPLILDLYGFEFSRSNFKIFTAQSAEEGLKIIEKEKPDLIFIDIVMPGKDGFWLIQQIKTNHREEISDIPIIMLTNLNDPESRRRCCEAGCLFYLVKTDYVPSQLVKMVKDILAVKKHTPKILANK